MRFADIDLSKLPAPNVIININYEDILQEWKNKVLELDPNLSTALSLESEPLVIDGQATAYQFMLLYQKINESAKSVMLAFSSGANLDHLAALFKTVRLTDETDDRLRTRTQMALEAITTAGSRGSYEYHALSTSNLVKDVDSYSPGQGAVVVTVLSTNNEGIADSALISQVTIALNEENVRPISDKRLIVQKANIIEYEIEATIKVGSGADYSLVLNASIEKINQYINDNFLLNRPHSLSGIYDALHEPEVRIVNLISPIEDILPANFQVARCTNINVSISND